MEKVDWIVSEILTQLVKFVPANVKNTHEVITKLENLEKGDFTEEMTFVSLDVVNLYPSINIEFGIKAVLEFAEENWHIIDNWLLTLENLK